MQHPDQDRANDFDAPPLRVFPSHVGSSEGQKARERHTLHEVHHEEQLVFGLNDVERRYDVGVVDARREASFVEKHRHELGVARVLRAQALHRDLARKTGRPREETGMDGRHAARGKWLVDRVAPHGKWEYALLRASDFAHCPKVSRACRLMW